MISSHNFTTTLATPMVDTDARFFVAFKPFRSLDTTVHQSFGNQLGHSYTQKNISGAITTRQYMPNYEFVVDSLGNETYIIYLCNGSIAVHDKTAGTKTLYHGYYDAQGSLIALTDNSSNVIARYAYDPWGGRVSPTDWTQSADAPDVLDINRGYTMHERLDEFDFINMNGRVYDPAVAQFLSPDPYIQDADNWLNYNRYAYCYNNPTRYVDPSGEIITGLRRNMGLQYPLVH